MRRLTILMVALGAAVMLAAGYASSAGAYGGGASHEMWQVGLSFNCDSPTSPFCLDENGQPSLGGFWGWVEFDRAGSQTWGDAQLTGCGHTTGGGGRGTAGADHFSLDISAWHLAPAQPQDPNYNPDPALNGQDFYVDHYTVTFTGPQGGTFTDQQVPDFLGDTQVPAEPGHYAFHPAPGVAGMTQVAYRAAH